MARLVVTRQFANIRMVLSLGRRRTATRKKIPITPSDETRRQRNRFKWGFGETLRRQHRGGGTLRRDQVSRKSDGKAYPPLEGRGREGASQNTRALKHQRLGLLDLRQGL